MNKAEKRIVIILFGFIAILGLMIFFTLKNVKLEKEISGVQRQIKIEYELNAELKQEINGDTLVTELIKEPNPSEFEKVGLDYEWFNQMSNKYKISSAYALAVFNLETGNGTSGLWLESNNPAGIKKDGVYATYKTQEEGIESMFKLMNNYAYERYLTTIEQQRGRWSESEDTQKIINLINEIKENENE